MAALVRTNSLGPDLLAMPMAQKAFVYSLLLQAAWAAVQIVVVDEIGSPAEAAAVRGIAQRGVAMVGTAHGTDLSSLLANPDLNSLIGGVHQVTLGDAEARSGSGHIGDFANIHRAHLWLLVPNMSMGHSSDPKSRTLTDC